MGAALIFTGSGTGIENSRCGRYKYAQYFRWDTSRASVMFVLLNPSNDSNEKIKIERCIAHAKGWGFGEVYITYLFAYVTAYVQQLSRANARGLDIIGPDNNLESIGRHVDQVTFAWGPFGGIGTRDKQVMALFPEDAFCIELSVAGYPREPGSMKMGSAPRKYTGSEKVALQ